MSVLTDGESMETKFILKTKLRVFLQSNVVAVKVERRTNQCKAALKNAIRKIDDLCSLPIYNVKPIKAHADLESFLKNKTEANDKLMQKPQNYLKPIQILFFGL